ncbi:MAG TPA: hypothetical protein VFS00_25220, partial [Polyangiaceae bacterium]|nr:hypothetical protein [Polyangiaceae bacterium]
MPTFPLKETRMRPRHAGLVAAACLLLSASAALAQPTGREGAEPEAAAPAAPAARAAATPGAPASCLLATRPKAQEDSARTAARLLCDELRGQGVSIGDLSDQAVSGGDAYRIDIEPLGGQLMVRVAYESPVGTPRATRRLVLSGYEEMNVAAGRLAEALVRDKPLGETATVGNVVQAESAPVQKKRGDTLFGLGLIGLSVPAAGVYAAPGAEMSFFYDATDVAIGISAAIAGGKGASGGSGRSTFADFSVGARRYFSRSDFSPYLGGGAAYS